MSDRIITLPSEKKKKKLKATKTSIESINFMDRGCIYQICNSQKMEVWNALCCMSYFGHCIIAQNFILRWCW